HTRCLSDWSSDVCSSDLIARHAITQQPFVAGAVLQSEIGAVIEIHIHEAELHDRAGNLCAEAQRNALLGLNMDDEAVGFQISYRSEEHTSELQSLRHLVC